jgi:hypothetical protein
MDFFKSLSLILGLLSGFSAILLTIAGGGDGLWEHEGMIRVQRSKARAFEVMTKPEFRMKWIEGLVESKVVPGKELDEDSSLVEVIMVDGVRQTRTLEVVAFESDSLVTFKYMDGDVAVEMHYGFKLFRSSGKATVTYACDAQYPGTAAKVIEPILGHKRQGVLDTNLARYKAIVEQGF